MPLGVFDPELRREALFDPLLISVAWYDPEFIDSGAPSTYTGTSALTHSSGSLSTTATVTNPTFTGTSSLSHSSGSLVSTAQFSPGIRTATSVLSHSSGSLVTSATFSPGVHTATSVLTHSSGVLSTRGSINWPIKISSNGRYLTKSDGTPLLLIGDAPWSIEVQLTQAQVDSYLDTRLGQGFNAILFETMEHFFSDQSPAYKNHAGDQPFSTMTDYGSSKTEAYWQFVDYVVNGCWSRGMVCIINPAYLGFSGTEEGWDTEVGAESDADLTTYGTFLGNRYTQGNIIWCAGGDAAGDTTLRNKQGKIFDGITSVQSGVLATGHNARSDSDAYSNWSGYSWFNVNSIYTDLEPDSEAATAWGRTGPYPFLLIEAYYENEHSMTAAQLRRQNYSAILSGALAGVFYGNSPVWDFGSSPGTGGGVTNALTHLTDTGATQIVHVGTLFNAYHWEKLQPKTDTSLVTTSLGTNPNRIIPAKASDSTFAMILTPNVNFTVAMSVFSGVLSSVRGRWFNPADGTYSTASGSPYSPSGTHAFTAIGERVLVLDQGPVTYTGTSSLTHSSGSLTTSATFSPGTHTGSSVLTHTSGSLTTSATYSPGVHTGSSVLIHGHGNLVTSATFSPGVHTGSSVLIHGHGNLVTSATFVPPAGVFTGTSTLTHGHGNLVTSATFVAPVYHGSSSLSHTGGQLVTNALFSAPVYHGNSVLAHSSGLLQSNASFSPPPGVVDPFKGLFNRGMFSIKV